MQHDRFFLPTRKRQPYLETIEVGRNKYLEKKGGGRELACLYSDLQAGGPGNQEVFGNRWILSAWM